MAGPAFGTNVGLDFTFLTISNLGTNSQFRFVTLGSDGYITVSGAGARSVGVLQSNESGSTATPKGCSVRTGGTSKIYAATTFNAGDLLSSNASGMATKYTAAVSTGATGAVSGTQVLGIAVEAGATGQLTTILFQPSGLSA